MSTAEFSTRTVRAAISRAGLDRPTGCRQPSPDAEETLTCPRCKAPAGTRCHDPNGNEVSTHAARIDGARYHVQVRNPFYPDEHTNAWFTVARAVEHTLAQEIADRFREHNRKLRDAHDRASAQHHHFKVLSPVRGFTYILRIVPAHQKKF
jgi:hypothetical protein